MNVGNFTFVDLEKVRDLNYGMIAENGVAIWLLNAGKVVGNEVKNGILSQCLNTE